MAFRHARVWARSSQLATLGIGEGGIAVEARKWTAPISIRVVLSSSLSTFAGFSEATSSCRSSDCSHKRSDVMNCCMARGQTTGGSQVLRDYKEVGKFYEGCIYV